MRIARYQGKFNRFRALDGPSRRLLLRAAFELAIARALLATVPFGKLAARLETADTLLPSNPDPEFLSSIGRAITTAAYHVPWRSDCLPQTIAASRLLSAYGYRSTIHLGVERTDDKRIAGHAWLSCGETVVVGEPSPGRYTEIHQIMA